MAVTVTDSTVQPASFSIGPRKIQLVKLSANSGATSGTITADNLRVVDQVIAPSAMVFTAAKTYSGNVATLAFTVPTETAASRTIDGVLYTAVANQGANGNNITIQIVDGTGDTPAVTKGTETVAVSGSAIVVHIDPTAVTGSARTDVKAAIIASAAASALVTPSTVTSGTTVAAVTSATALQSGVTGGVVGVDCICVGY
jgi:hypothetical protein